VWPASASSARWPSARAAGSVGRAEPGHAAQGADFQQFLHDGVLRRREEIGERAQAGLGQEDGQKIVRLGFRGLEADAIEVAFELRVRAAGHPVAGMLLEEAGGAPPPRVGGRDVVQAGLDQTPRGADSPGVEARVDHRPRAPAFRRRRRLQHLGIH